VVLLKLLLVKTANLISRQIEFTYDVISFLPYNVFGRCNNVLYIRGVEDDDDGDNENEMQ